MILQRDRNEKDVYLVKIRILFLININENFMAIVIALKDWKEDKITHKKFIDIKY